MKTRRLKAVESCQAGLILGSLFCVAAGDGRSWPNF
jgi:hypothetical protein